MSDLQKENNSQNKLLVTVFNKLKELDSRRKKSDSGKNRTMSPLTTSTNSSMTIGGMNTSSKFTKKDGTNYSSKITKPSTIKPYGEFLSFKPIKEHQVVSGPLISHLYKRGGVNDYVELTYKLLR